MERTGGLLLGCLALFYTLVYSVQSNSTHTDFEVHCEDEYFFKPTCDNDDVILIGYARYGRMREGICTTDGFGHLGCSMDALGVLNNKCSGKSTCEVWIASIPPRDDPPCPKGLRGYLEVAYECVNVIQSPRGYCRPTDVTEVRDQHGYLSSLIAEESRCGSVESPWWVSAKPGQTLQFQLLAFDEVDTSTNPSLQTYAMLNEESGDTVTITKERSGYISEGNRVEVTLAVPDADNQEQRNFLLRFEATGCPDILPPANAWVRRNGKDATVGCNAGHLQWTMACIKDEWVGRMETCPADSQGEPEAAVPDDVAANDEPSSSFLNESNALIIMAAVGVLIIIGLCLLILGLVYICRRWKSARRVGKQQSNDSRRSRMPNNVQRSLMEEDPEEDYYCPPEGEYYRTWQKTRGANRPYPPRSGASVAGTPLPPPPYTPSGTLASRGNGRWPGQDTEHIYERPTFVIPPQEEGTECDTRSMRTSYKCPDVHCDQCDHDDHMNTV